MASLNKVMLIGNLTRDPSLKTTPSGYSICDFGLAVNRRYRNQQGEEHEEVCFTDITYFGKQADICSRYLHKGDPIFVEGRLRYESWTDKATQKIRNRLVVTGEVMQFLNKANSGQSESRSPGLPPPPAPFSMPVNAGNASGAAPAEPPPEMHLPAGTLDEGNAPGFTEEIPF